MKNAFFILLLLSLNSLQALPVGNPAEPKLLSTRYRVGFYGDYVFNRHLRAKKHFEIEETKSFTNAAYLALNFCERIECFATLGATYFSLFVPVSTVSSSGDVPLSIGLRMNAPSHFSWSLGARFILFEWRCWILGVEGSYFQTCSRISSIHLLGDFRARYPNTPFEYREGEIGLGVAKRFHSIVPYMALKWSRVKTKSKADLDFGATRPISFPNLENSKSLGYALGASWTRYKKILLTVEGRFADEKALYINAQGHF